MSRPLKENTFYLFYTIGVTVLLIFFICYSILISIMAKDLVQVIQGYEGGYYQYGQSFE